MMKTNVGIAQIRDNENNVERNLETHEKLIRLAGKQGVRYLLFPEMSLTGYLREGAAGKAVHRRDPIVSRLRDLSVELEMVISVGAPFCDGTKFYIGTLILEPNGTESVYAKKFLHPGEELFFQTNHDHDPVISVDAERVSNAICFDIENPDHLESSAVNRSTVYSASIFYSDSGIDGGLETLRKIAIQKDLPVLMSNYCGKCWNLTAGGKSTIWDKNGCVVVQAPSNAEALLLGEKSGDSWTGRLVEV